MNTKILKYFFLGGISTLIHLLIAFLYIFYINDTLFIANVVGFLFAYIFSYIMQSILVFKNSLGKIKALKYFIVQSLALIVSVSIADILSDYSSYIKIIFTILMMPLVTYTIHKFWTFKG